MSKALLYTVNHYFTVTVVRNICEQVKWNTSNIKVGVMYLGVHILWHLKEHLVFTAD